MNTPHIVAQVPLGPGERLTTVCQLDAGALSCARAVGVAEADLEVGNDDERPPTDGHRRDRARAGRCRSRAGDVRAGEATLASRTPCWSRPS